MAFRIARAADVLSHDTGDEWLKSLVAADCASSGRP